MQWHFFEKESGLFHEKVVVLTVPKATEQATARANAPDGHVPIAGVYDSLSQRVDIETGAVVDYQPPAPSADHEWNATSKRWQLTAAVQAKARARQTALAQIAVLEASGVRAARELALNQAGALDRLQAIDAAIAKLRADL